MGYTTKFIGTIKFNDDVTVAEVRELRKWLDCDSREIEPDIEHQWYYMDFVIAPDMSGIQHNGAEKSYGMVEELNWLVAKVREKHPNFTLHGELNAQGEEASDRWILRIDGDVAERIDNSPKGKSVICPDCNHEFYPEETEG